MRIVVNDIAASHGGAITILKDFYKSIIESGDKNEWIFILSDMYIDETENIKVLLREDIKKSWLKRALFDVKYGSKYIEKLNPDIVISLQNTLIKNLNIPQIVYIHQAIPFQKVKHFSFLKKEERIYAIYQYIIGRLIKNSAKIANLVVVQTNWMKDALINDLLIDLNKIEVIRPSVKKIDWDVECSDEKINFFYPAEKDIYKNHECIFEAINLLKSRDDRKFNIDLTIDSYKGHKEDEVNYLGRIKRDEVIDRMSKSILVFPSYIETLGLPLIEAMELNRIILVADCEYSREVLQGYSNVYYFDPFKSNELADLMGKIINGDIHRDQCKILNAKKYKSWNDLIKIINNKQW